MLIINEMLTENNIQRYGRQLILKGWNSEKQLKLGNLSAFIPEDLPAAALYLAAAGIGKLVLPIETSFSKHISKFNSNVLISFDQEATDILLVADYQTQTEKKIEILENNSRLEIVSYLLGGNPHSISTLAAAKIISLVDREVL